MQPGTLITVDVEKPIAGGRMLARHNGQIVLVSGAIPGERVSARVSRVAKGVIYADMVDPVVPSPDRRASVSDGRCGGNVLSHVSPERQVRLKGEILEDAFRRVARLPLGAVPEVVASPELGYRMRARFHVRGDQVGFLREASHELCDAEATGQLLPETVAWIRLAAETLRREKLRGLQSIEIAENIPATERAGHLELVQGEDPTRYEALAAGLIGLSAQPADAHEPTQLAGRPSVADDLHVVRGDSQATLHLARDVRAFFQGNRYLLEQLVSHVVGLVPDGPVVDLYAGVGLFGLSLAALGHDTVTLVEGDRSSGASLVSNATPFGAGIQVQRLSVEHFLRVDRVTRASETVIVDPPRTGLSPDALAGVLRRQPSRLVYVSCDVATLARDTRRLVDAGYELANLRGFDLFPNTAHVESVAELVFRT